MVYAAAAAAESEPLISEVAHIDDTMSTHLSSNWPYVFNLSNSIIGVALLALPFCFKEVYKHYQHNFGITAELIITAANRILLV